MHLPNYGYKMVFKVKEKNGFAMTKGHGNVAFECLGKEKGKDLSHAFDKMWLQKLQGEGELWAKQKR